MTLLEIGLIAVVVVFVLLLIARVTKIKRNYDALPVSNGVVNIANELKQGNFKLEDSNFYACGSHVSYYWHSEFGPSFTFKIHGQEVPLNKKEQNTIILAIYEGKEKIRKRLRSSLDSIGNFKGE